MEYGETYKDTVRHARAELVELEDYTTADVISYLSGLFETQPMQKRTLYNWRCNLCKIEGIDIVFGELLEDRGTVARIDMYEKKHLKLFIIYGYYIRRYRSAQTVLKCTAQFINKHYQLLTDEYTLGDLKDELIK